MANNRTQLAIGLLITVFAASGVAVAGKGENSNAKNTAQAKQNAFGHTYRYQKKKADRPAYQYRNPQQFTHSFTRKKMTLNYSVK